MRPGSRVLWVGVGTVILALYTQRLQYQNYLWSDGLVLWQNAHDTAPKATLSTGELSLMLVERKMYNRAIPHLEEALKHQPHLFEVYMQLCFVVLFFS